MQLHMPKNTAHPQDLVPYGDNFIPILRPGYPVIHAHTPENPFCPDRTCPCNELDEEAINKAQEWYLDGIITASDATDIIMGRKQW